MKTVIVFLMCIPLFLFTGCTKEYYLNYTELAATVNEAYIVEVQRSEYYSEASVEYIRQIRDGELDDFLMKLSNLRFEYSVFLEPANNTGKAIMLKYNGTDYDYTIIGKNGIEKFKDGEQKYLYNATCDENALSSLINEYFAD